MKEYGFLKIIFICSAFFVLFFANLALAQTSSEVLNFYIDRDFDAISRTQVQAVMVKTTQKLYFYIEKEWWDSKSNAEKDEIKNGLDGLAKEFEGKIYPVLTQVYGSEWNPGVDGDSKISILFHKMREDAAGYFRAIDEYIKIQLPESNEREMLYLSLSHINNPKLKNFLGHEFTHLISFNQKEKKFGVEEEVWLNEARAEYALNILGYDDEYEGSNLHANWTIALFLNDCSLDIKYCYLNKNLRNLKISPTINFLPVSGNTYLSVNNIIKNWSGNWQKIIGGNGKLRLEFSSLTGLSFKIPYITEDKKGNYSVKFLALAKNARGEKKGEINIEKFGTEIRSLTITPSLQTKTSGFDELEFAYPFTFTASIEAEISADEQATIKKLLEEIDYLKNEIAKILAQRNNGSSNQNPAACLRINSNLYQGAGNKNEVKCLQSFLKSQGAGIYPEALVTGYFGSLTRMAVARFQEKYASEILIPLGLEKGTGFVGVRTRAKINGILSER
ncbi:MAG: hypothetical protein HYT36_00385 [Candidatus Staskawiczbacteria bacterium]|nr:hypothetical protein [Candidatus Staskawiczbacteria bacterium]